MRKVLLGNFYLLQATKIIFEFKITCNFKNRNLIIVGAVEVQTLSSFNISKDLIDIKVNQWQSLL